MPQPETPKLSGTWKALFIGPNPRIVKELAPLLSKLLPTFSLHDLNAYPNRHQFAEVLASEGPNLCFLEISDPYERGLSLIADILRTDAKLPIIVVLSSNDPELVLRCLRQGASDFLILPFTPDQVEAALHKVARQQPTRLKTPGRVYCVVPAKGGCGASTIASNLAYQLKRGDKRILLADLDPLAGTLSFLLKIKSAYSFMDVLARAQDIDGDLWRTLITSRNGVDVLLSPEVMTEGMSDLKDARGIIEYARHTYDLVVLDSGGAYGDWNLSMAQLADEILLVTTNELTSLQSVQRVLGYLDANNIPRFKLRLIVNRYDRHTGLSKDVIGTALHTEIFHILPADYEAIQKSLMEGKPLAPNTSFGKSMISLVDHMAGSSEPHNKKGSSLSGLLSLFSRTS